MRALVGKCHSASAPREVSMRRTASEGSSVLKMPSLATVLSAEVRTVAVRRALLAEFLGTLLLVFFTAGAVVVTAGILGGRLSASGLLAAPIPHGLAFGRRGFASGASVVGRHHLVLLLAAVPA